MSPGEQCEARRFLEAFVKTYALLQSCRVSEPRNLENVTWPAAPRHVMAATHAPWLAFLIEEVRCHACRDWSTTGAQTAAVATLLVALIVVAGAAPVAGQGPWISGSEVIATNYGRCGDLTPHPVSASCVARHLAANRW